MSRGRREGDAAESAGTARPKRQATGAYKVGKGRPPDETKFTSERQPAKRGGRRKGRKNHATELREIFAFKLTDPSISEKIKKLSALGQLVWKQYLRAMSGDTRAFNAVIDHAREYGVLTPEPPEAPQTELTAAEQATVDDYFASFAIGKGIDLEALIASSAKADAEEPKPAPIGTVTLSPRGPNVRMVVFGPREPRTARR